ncbi:hypothetical protein HK100_010679, partial [Physocladia obscura]
NLKNSNETVADLRTKLGASEQIKIDSVREAREEETALRNKLYAEKATLEHQIVELQKLIDQIQRTEQAAKHELEEEITRIKRQTTAQTSTTNTLTSENKTLSHEIQTLLSQSTAYQSRVQDLESKIQTLLAEKQDACHEIDNLNDRIVHLEESLQGTRMEAVQKDENLAKEEQAYKHNLDLYR